MLDDILAFSDTFEDHFLTGKDLNRNPAQVNENLRMQVWWSVAASSSVVVLCVCVCVHVPALGTLETFGASFC